MLIICLKYSQNNPIRLLYWQKPHSEGSLPRGQYGVAGGCLHGVLDARPQGGPALLPQRPEV
jgi:hypothetical protein